MKRFKDGQRVRVVAKGSLLTGCTGVVVRLRRSDDCAWVEMNADLPETLYARFPRDDPRARHVLLDPADCEMAAL